MEIRKKFRPFTNDDEYTFSLDNKTLALVLCQVQWPELANLKITGNMDAIVSQFEKLASEQGYQIYQRLNNVTYTVSPTGIQENKIGIIHQWTTVDGAWHINLSEQMVSLYTTSYEGFDTFKKRLEIVLHAVIDMMKIPYINRIGMRYVNQLSDETDIENLGKLVKSGAIGYSELETQYLNTSINQAFYIVDGVAFQVRSGILAEGQTPDPSIAPLSKRSWILDLDANDDTQKLVNVDAVLHGVSKLADIDFDYFKNMVTPEFVAKYTRQEGNVE